MSSKTNYPSGRVPQGQYIIWNRVSTVSQQENYSLDFQEAKCKEYLKNKGITRITKNKIFNIVGSGYNLSRNTMIAYEELLTFDTPIILCLCVDRFSRNQTVGNRIYNGIKENGGKIIFVLDNFDTSSQSGEELFYEKLKQAESESIIKSQKVKANNKFIMKQRINDSYEGLFYISKFICSMINGDEVQNIFENFRYIVDWNSIPGLKKSHYQNPIEFDDDIYTDDGKSVKKGAISFVTIAHILNDFQVEITIKNIRNTKWSENLCRDIYDYSDKKTDFLDLMIL